MRRGLLLVAAAALVAGCGSSGTAAREVPAARSAAPSPSASPPPAPSVSPLDLTPRLPWPVGASPLPLRPDGFGQVLPTPEVLRDRRFPTKDLLAPPAQGRFASTVGAVTPAIRARMGATWSESCPVPLRRLRYVTVSFRGFDGKPHTGELVVAARAAGDVVAAFRELYAARFPIEEMRLPTTADLRAKPTGDGNNTAAYVCRTARGQTRFSAHAYGLAVDVNPFHNPLVKRDLVVPELASAYADRTERRPGMLLAGSAEVRSLTSRGWTWGGAFRSLKDPMHFSLTGD